MGQASISGQMNKANSRQNMRTRGRGNQMMKLHTTIRNKERRLKRHLKSHDGDHCAKAALDRWNKRY
jgi:hypothetical protein